MANDFDRILDECIDRVNKGESIQDCLAAYPDHAEKLEPMLRAMTGVQDTYSFTPSANAKRQAREKFYATLDKRRRPSLLSPFTKLFMRPVTWAVVSVAVVVLTVIGVLSQQGPSPIPVLVTPNPDGNFAFLISDEPNDIGDFENLNVTIAKVSLISTDASKSTEFVPETTTVDLTKLQGEASQEVWRGNIASGQYSGVIVYVSDVQGKLKSTGQIISVKLPGNKLHMSTPFEISADEVTSFTFDITVIETGKNGKYILKPQAGESGAK